MVVDAVRTYLDAASGLTELSRKQAVAAAKTLLRANGAGVPAPVVADGEAPPRVGQSIQALAGELIETSQANRAAVADLVRDEVRYALEQMDMVPRAEYERMARRVAELERRMAARHAVERVLAPRGGASSVLPAREESVREADRDGQASPEAEPRGRGSLTVGNAVAAESGAGAAGSGPAAVGEDEPTTGADGVTGDLATEKGASVDTARGSSEGTEVETGAQAGGDEGAAAEPTTDSANNRGKAKTAAKSTRARSTVKRTTKGKGTKK